MRSILSVWVIPFQAYENVESRLYLHRIYQNVNRMHKLILASKSPRRSWLLQQAGFTFELRVADVEEDFPADMHVDEVAGYLARKKAQAIPVYPNEVLLTADSVVILDDVIFGKPTDYDDAVRILRALSGRMHRVITGVCLRTTESEQLLSDESKVYFEPLSDAEIDYYTRTCAPYDKAGAYAIQEWIGLCKIARLEGSYANVMGLPVHRVYEALKSYNLQ